MVDRSLSSTWSVPRPAIALLIFGVLASLSAVHLALYQGRPWALLALLTVPVGGWFVARRPEAVAGLIIAGSLMLMLGYAGTGYADQTDLGRAAFAALLRGESPWQVHHFANWSNPFAYGPLAMLIAQLGPRLELVSAVALLGVLAWTRSWVTLGVLAAFPPFVNLALTGINDYTPALLIVSGLLLGGWRGGVVLGVAAAIKPYAAAWFLMAPWAFASVLLWLPFVAWWVDFAAMLRVTSGMAGFTPLRLLALPFAIGEVLARSWRSTVLMGVGLFAAVMLFGQWASLGYWIVLIPVVGMAFEVRPVDRRWPSSRCCCGNKPWPGRCRGR